MHYTSIGWVRRTWQLGKTITVAEVRRNPTLGGY
jgi:hypothetical protein